MTALLAALSLVLAMIPPGIDLIPRGEEEESTRPVSIEERLEQRLADLAEAPSEQAGEAIAEEVRSLWRQSGGATAQLLLDRAERALAENDRDTAERQYAHLRRLEPEFAEGWFASAQLAIARGQWDFALDALTETVSLEPRRFDAYALLGRALERASEPRAALAAYEEALRVHPWHAQARQARARLEDQLAGRAL
ncbi:MAG: tetratricopeptide repeat protein [Oceanicaulis sp.]|uniref:tetratricopeptide repeat protein n=1 Tax=Glycocaulis sp. TaxID=1969725 RepID=UPI0025B9D4A6|nr:tetratricopeptide repeat protein [Glycocaulis sp.]MCC5981742.1 tetratricopeptide repeat protein [Oceanicaulis sp.]MCH8520841.1 tetratricopeptide repeat protein [Glycocaulis sp.]